MEIIIIPLIISHVTLHVFMAKCSLETRPEGVALGEGWFYLQPFIASPSSSLNELQDHKTASHAAQTVQQCDKFEGHIVDSIY